MANFGTPTVIGTLTSSTSQTSYTVPITATTGLSDGIFIVVSSGGTGANNTPSAVSDSQNPQSYSQISTVGTPGQTTTFQLLNSKILTNTDTVTVTFPVANTFLKSIVVVDCPGAIALDVSSIATNSGSSANPTVTTNTSGTPELIFFVTDNNNLGGAPSGFGSFTNLVTLHSGSSPWTSVSYQIVNSPGPVTATETITSAAWTSTAVGFLANIPLYNPQQPFEIGLVPITLAFNPNVQFRVPPPQPPIPTVISSPPVNIQGSQANVFVNGVNSLKGDAANFASTTGNWTNGGNTTIVQTNAVSQNGQGALQATATAGGAITILSSTSGKIQQNGLPASNGDTIFAAVWVLAATVGRSAQVGFSMVDANQNVLGSTQFGSAQTDSTATWILLTATNTVNQANTAYVRENVQWTSAGASEVHYISNAWLVNLTTGAGMGELSFIYQNFFQQFQLQPDGVPYPLSLNSSLQYLPRQIQTAPASVFQPGAVANVNVSAPAGVVQTFQTFSPQFPWQQIYPGLQFNPSLNWVKQQVNTSNPVTYIDGGTAPNVVVNAQFPDMAAVVSVSAAATANVNVAAPAPPTVIAGSAANVSVAAPSPSLNVRVAGVVANVNVAAQAGSVNTAVPGTAGTVNVAVPSGQTVRVSPQGTTPNVAVGSANDNVVVIKMGTVANVAVASTGQVAASSVTGQVVNANVASPAGIITESMIGVPAQVNVASSGSVTFGPIGPTAGVTVVAPPGAAGVVHPVFGVTANVTVATTSNAQITVAGTTGQITAVAPAGSVNRSIAGPTANVNVSASAGFAGTIDLSGTLYSPDFTMDQLLSEQGKLLEIPVMNELVSETD